MTGRLEEAATDLRAACSALEALGADVQGQLAHCLAHEGATLRRLGRLPAAEAAYRAAIDAAGRAGGSDHPDRASLLIAAAALWQTQQRLGEAMAALGEAHRIRQAHFGAAHRETRACAAQLALVRDEMDGFAAARPLYEQAFAISHEPLQAADEAGHAE